MINVDITSTTNTMLSQQKLVNVRSSMWHFELLERLSKSPLNEALLFAFSSNKDWFVFISEVEVTLLRYWYLIYRPGNMKCNVDLKTDEMQWSISHAMLIVRKKIIVHKELHVEETHKNSQGGLVDYLCLTKQMVLSLSTPTWWKVKSNHLEF